MEKLDSKQELFLFQEMKEGKEYAFDFFFNYYYPGLCVYGQKLFPIAEDEARNIVQDVFLKFWDERTSINIQSSVKAYLFVSVRNKCLDFVRKEKKSPETIDISDLRETENDSFETYILSELESLLNKSLEKLPDRCREIFELSRFSGLKNKEIAAQLKITEKTVENQMTKALRILKTELKDYLPLLLLFDSFRFFN